MLEDIKNKFYFHSIDKLISHKNYDEAFQRLNCLADSGYRLFDVILKRGNLCKKLLMSDEAYSDFSYLINNFFDNEPAYRERMLLSFELENYKNAINDAEKLLQKNPDNLDIKMIKFFSYVFLGNYDEAKNLIMDIFNFNNYKIIQFILNECAKLVSQNELSKGLKLLEIIELIDSDNPLKLLNEANIYGLVGDEVKKSEILTKIEAVFPKYFLSHYKFTDIYEDRDLLEICFLLELKIFDKYDLFSYQMSILEGYKFNIEGHIIDSKEAFEKAVNINSDLPEAYVLLAQTLQLMSGYDNPQYKEEAYQNYKKALSIYEKSNMALRAEDMKRQIQHLNSMISL